jgi:hypothetical protein
MKLLDLVNLLKYDEATNSIASYLDECTCCEKCINYNKGLCPTYSALIDMSESIGVYPAVKMCLNFRAKEKDGQRIRRTVSRDQAYR